MVGSCGAGLEETALLRGEVLKHAFVAQVLVAHAEEALHEEPQRLAQAGCVHIAVFVHSGKSKKGR